MATTSRAYPRGTIAALVIAGTLALLLILFAIFFFVFWRPRVQRERQRRRELLRQKRQQDKMRALEKGDNPNSHFGNFLDISTGPESADEARGDKAPYLYGDIRNNPKEGSRPSSSNSILAGRNWKGNKKAKLRDSPSFTLDIPIANVSPTRERRASASSGSDSEGPAPIPLVPPPPAATERRVSWQDPPPRRPRQQPDPSGVTTNPPPAPPRRERRRPAAENRSDYVAVPPGDTVELSLSPRSPDQEGQGSWNRGASLGAVHDDGDVPILRVRASSPFRVDFISGASRRISRDTRRAGVDATRNRRSRLSMSSVPRRAPQPEESSPDSPERPPVKGKGKQTSRSTEARNVGEGSRSQAQGGPLDLPSSTSERHSFLDLSSEDSPQSSSPSHHPSAGSDRKKSRWSESTIPSLRNPPPSGQAQPQSQRSHWSATTVPTIRTEDLAGMFQRSSDPSPEDAETPLSPQVTSPVQRSVQFSASGRPSVVETTARTPRFAYPLRMPHSDHHEVEGGVDSQPLTPLTPPPAHRPSADVPSPTESIPMTVSDIHFRNSEAGERGTVNSGRTSTGSHRPPHPPLPGIARGHRTQTRSLRASAAGATSRPSPPLIVQRVLGLNTPPPPARAETSPPPASSFPPPASSFPPPASSFPPPASSFPPPASSFPPPASSFPPSPSIGEYPRPPERQSSLPTFLGGRLRLGWSKSTQGSG
jgi:hypothetical protein